jgi:coatomer protein complex subunit alpha (xenin)
LHTLAGVPASQKWLERRTQLAAEHAAAGQFSSAMSLLFRQLGVVAFEPLKPHMLELYNASHAVLPGLQVGGCLSRFKGVVESDAHTSDAVLVSLLGGGGLLQLPA